MRRNEFEITDKKAIDELLNTCEYGVLSLLDNGVPYGVPLNFACMEEGIVFHGAHEGKKMEIIAQNELASFNVVKSYSFIPSYFSGTTAACPATQFFASVTLSGKLSVIENMKEKTDALNALMEKLQPEKHYETIDTSNPIYTKMVEKTAVIRFSITHATMKLKLGQQLPKERRDHLIQQLEERGTTLDLLTANAMKKSSLHE
ncbi:MAG: pyridoxamine 5'-phosphate oxidase family protein [Sulfurospirillaceae bacterium]|nr:pyridoxamine 5'-phosphate oxidase family protein [Sulfurospirillaceae bacterium]